MPIVRILLVLLALTWPAFADDGAQDAANAREPAQAFRIYVEGVAKAGGRPDLTEPETATLLGRVFDLAALNALPPAQASDLPWLMDWIEAANSVNKLITRFDAMHGSQPDYGAIQRNAVQYEDQYVAALDFLIRGQARQALSIGMFVTSLRPEQRTRIREEGFAGARAMSAELIQSALCSVILGGAKAPNVRRVTAALRDTRDIWANYFATQDRARMVNVLAGLSQQLSDEMAQNDLSVVRAALDAKS